MDKNSFETYEFLPGNGNEAEHDQFFVVQDDGTFLINRQIQYVAQVKDVKEVLEDVQPCTVYGVGVSSQQFFVDVTNSDELISVSDQFILPDGDNGLYTNSYLLQPSSSTTTVNEQMEADVVDQFKQPNNQDVEIEVATPNSKQGNNPTEFQITLSDKQYQMLEQKGWILLELNDKIFVLNTLGLHDITTNDKLIQKLKNEIQNDSNTGFESGTVKLENITGQFPNLVAQPFTNQQDTVEFVIGSNGEQDESMDNLQFVISEKDKTVAVIKSEDQRMYICDSTQDIEENNINEITPQVLESLSNSSSIKIKTKFNFKDIQDKIVLGKTVNGKRLVAKVVKKVNNTKQPSQPMISDEQVPDNNVMAKPENQEYISDNNTGMSETELVGLIQQYIRNELYNKVNPDDVKSADNVVDQLLRVPNLHSSLVGQNLIITKAKNNRDESGVIYNKGNVALVTGRLKETDDLSTAFEHLPEMLLRIKSISEESVTSGNQNLDCIDHEKAVCSIFHIHITETKSVDNVIRVSVMLNKRQLSINQMFCVKKRYPNTVFGCSACAALFKSEAALKEHQDKNCMDTDEMLTIDADKVDMVDAYTMIKTEKDKSYSCKQCGTNFNKLYSCIRHVKSHLGLSTTSKSETRKDSTNEQSDNDTQKGKEVYRCKICHSTYFHPATLSKHIVTRHIKVKAK